MNIILSIVTTPYTWVIFKINFIFNPKIFLHNVTMVSECFWFLQKFPT